MWIVLFAFGVRVAVRWYTGAADFWENGYRFYFALAQNIAAGSGFSLDGAHSTAFRVPLYPLFLAALTFGQQAFLPVLIAQSLIGAGSVLCAALIARELFGGTAAITAAVLVAVYPYYVVHDTALQETSLFTFLTALGVLLLLRARRSGSAIAAAGAGLVLGAAVLTRVTLAPFAAFAPVWLAHPGPFDREASRQRLRGALLCAGVLALTLSPWLVRSYWLTGAAMTSHFGYSLWVGNNPYTFSHYPGASIDRSRDAAWKALSSEEKSQIAARLGNEADVDEWFRQKALEFIREHPWLSFGNGLRKVTAVFSWLPSPSRSFWPSLAHALSYGPVMILGLWGMWAARRHWREHSIFYAQFAVFAAITAVLYGHTSHRAYLDVYWIVFVAGLLAAWLNTSLGPFGDAVPFRYWRGPSTLRRPS